MPSSGTGKYKPDFLPGNCQPRSWKSLMTCRHCELYRKCCWKIERQTFSPPVVMASSAWDEIIVSDSTISNKFNQNAEKRACFWPAFLQRQAKAAVDSTMWCFHPSMPKAASPSALSFSIFLSTVNRKAEKLERMKFSSIPGWWPAGPRGARAFSKIQCFGLKSWKAEKVERWKGEKVERWKDGKVEKSIDAWLTGQPASEERKHFQKHFGGQKVKSQKMETSINAHHWWFRLFHSRSRLLLFAHPRNARGLHGSCTLKPASSLANSTCWRSWWHACGM